MLHYLLCKLIFFYKFVFPFAKHNNNNNNPQNKYFNFKYISYIPCLNEIPKYCFSCYIFVSYLSVTKCCSFSRLFLYFDSKNNHTENIICSHIYMKW